MTDYHNGQRVIVTVRDAFSGRVHPTPGVYIGPYKDRHYVVLDSYGRDEEARAFHNHHIRPATEQDDQ